VKTQTSKIHIKLMTSRHLFSKNINVKNIFRAFSAKTSVASRCPTFSWR